MKQTYQIITNYIIYAIGNCAIEEVTHDWQSREVVSKIMKDNRLINLLKMQYINDSSLYVDKYELFDASTKEFMSEFKKDIQNINNGEQESKEFKGQVGKSIFDIYAQAAYLCVHGKAKINKSVLRLAYTSSEIEKNDSLDKLYPYRKAYTNLGNKLVSDMYSRRKIMLEKTKNLPMSKIA